MRRTIAALLLLCATGGVTAVAQEPEGVFPFDYRRVDLDNGLRAYLIDVPSPGQVAYVSMVRTGSRDEVEEGRSGFAHFFEHMMFRGTEKYPEYDSVTAAMGAARNAFTSDDMTVYYLVAATDYLELIADLESDRFRNLKYSESDFRTEAGAILGEYQNSAYSWIRVLDRAIRETAFLAHTYRHQTIGFEADVRAMPEGYEYSLDFHRRFYRPDNIVLVIAGDFDFDEAERIVRHRYEDWEAGYEPPQIPEEPVQSGSRVRTVEYPGRSLPVVSINFKAPAWSADDRLAVAMPLLGAVAFGPNSDIYRKLVIDEQRVQFLSADFELSRDAGLVSLTARVSDPAEAESVREELLAAVRRSRDELAEEPALEAARRHMRYDFLMGLETPQSVAFSLITPVINTGGLEAVDEYYATLASISAEEVREAARSVLVEDGMTLATLVQAERGQ